MIIQKLEWKKKNEKNNSRLCSWNENEKIFFSFSSIWLIRKKNINAKENLNTQIKLIANKVEKSQLIQNYKN